MTGGPKIKFYIVLPTKRHVSGSEWPNEEGLWFLF